MSKFLAFFASLLLIPAMAFGQNSCPTLSDSEYVDFFVSQSATFSLEDIIGDESNIHGTVSIKFHRNGKLTEHVKFSSPIGRGTVDIVADWSVINAVLSIHLVSATHSDTHNKELNKMLDELLDQVKAQPDISAPLNNCDNFKRSLHGFPYFLKK